MSPAIARIEYGWYGGVEQFFIAGVDGTVAQLGKKRPTPDQVEQIVADADRQHAALIAAKGAKCASARRK